MQLRNTSLPNANHPGAQEIAGAGSVGEPAQRCQTAILATAKDQISPPSSQNEKFAAPVLVKEDGRAVASGHGLLEHGEQEH